MTATATKTHWTDRLTRLDACDEAVAWARSYSSATAAWRACERGDYLLWVLGRCSGPPESSSRKAVVLAACECARLAMPHWTERYPDDGRPLAAIETAERWARGEPGVTLDDVRRSRASAYAAASACAAADADDAYASFYASAYADDDYASYAYAAFYAAAYAAAYAAYAASYAASYAADAYAAAYAARTSTLEQCAEIVRRHFPAPPAWVMRFKP